MRIAGFLLLPAGWGIAISAMALLPAGAALNAFILAGVGVEAIGLVLVARSHIHARRARR